jgi:hypothetical protein
VAAQDLFCRVNIMKIFVTILVVLLFCPASGYSTADDETKDSHIIQNDVISIGGTYRLRGEIDDEFNVKNTVPALRMTSFCQG